MSEYSYFLGAVYRHDHNFVYGKFLRHDGKVVEDLPMPLNRFNITPPVATVIIAKSRTSDGKLDLKFRTATLEEVRFLDSVELPEAMHWIRNTDIP